MFATFFTELRAAGVPVTLREYLTLMEAMEQDLADRRVESFYYLSRAALVKDERNLDKFDQVFGHVFKGLEGVDASLLARIPEEWLKALTAANRGERPLLEAIHGYEAEMLDYGFRAVRGSLRAMEQAIPKSNWRLCVSRTFFRIVDRVPLLKSWMFRGMGDE